MTSSVRLEASARMKARMENPHVWIESNVGWEYLTQTAQCVNNQTTEYVNPWEMVRVACFVFEFVVFCVAVIASYLPLVAMNHHSVFRPL